MKNWKIGKGILVVGLMLYGPMDVVAQSVTYNHDAAKMNQITVGETGSGSLTPTLYYQTLHKRTARVRRARTNCRTVPLPGRTWITRGKKRKRWTRPWVHGRNKKT